MPATPSAKPARGELLKALRLSDMKTAAALLEQGADPNETDGDGSTPLHTLTWHSPFDETMADLLLAHHANIDATTVMGYTPLIKAVFRHNLSAVQFLIAHGASLRMRDHGGFTALDHAHMENSPELAKILEDALAQEKQATLKEQFVDAFWAKDLDRLKALLDQGVDPDTRDKSYYNATPLYHIIGFNNLKMAQLLLDYKADPNARSQSFTPLMNAANMGSVAFANLLLDHGADPNLKNEAGVPALKMAAQHSPAIFRMLLERGADLAAIDPSTLTADARVLVEETIKQRQLAAFHNAAVDNQDFLRKHRIKTVLRSPGA